MHLFRFLIASLAPTTSASVLSRRATNGCGIRHDLEIGQTTHQTIQSSGRKRSFNVHLPEKYDAIKPTAMIIAYHGRHQGAEKLEQISKLSEESVNPRMIVIYPEGVDVCHLMSYSDP